VDLAAEGAIGFELARELAQMLTDAGSAADAEHVGRLPLRQTAVIAQHPRGDGSIDRVPPPTKQHATVQVQPPAYHGKDVIDGQDRRFAAKCNVLPAGLAFKQAAVERNSGDAILVSSARFAGLRNC
jgi:hypothetical protein